MEVDLVPAISVRSIRGNVLVVDKSALWTEAGIWAFNFQLGVINWSNQHIDDFGWLGAIYKDGEQVWRQSFNVKGGLDAGRSSSVEHSESAQLRPGDGNVFVAKIWANLFGAQTQEPEEKRGNNILEFKFEVRAVPH